MGITKSIKHAARGVQNLGAVLAIFLFHAVAVHAAETTVVGPAAGRPVLDLGQFDIGALGYVTEEFFVSGMANSYKASSTPDDGRWTVETAESAPFTTRVVVVRPRDSARFNGTVLVEWLNVTGGGDLSVDWKVTHRLLVREGFAYVGVSAQRVSIEGSGTALPGAEPLKKADPARYGTLSHPGDAFAYDIFTHAGRAARGTSTVRLLGPLTPQRILAAGESQSAGFMTTYVNAIDPLSKVFDGFFIHSRSGGSAPVEGRVAMREGSPPTPARGPVRIRPDVRVPVMTLLAENDVLGRGVGGYFGARQPDSERFRAWEIAGTAHGDTYIAKAGYVDSGLLSIEELAAAFAATDVAFGQKMKSLMNGAPQHHYVAQAAIHHLNRWARDGQLPPRGGPLTVVAGAAQGDPPSLAHDKYGSALGGVRSPWMDVPTATLSGTSLGGEGFAFLFGSTVPFDAATLKALYPGGRADYLVKFKDSLDGAIAAGFLLNDDAAEIMALAAAMYPEK